MKINLALLQANLVWEDAKKNIEKFDSMLDDLSANVDIVLLPEMFSTGFTMNVENPKNKIGTSTLDWMKNKSKTLSVILAGSVLAKENNKYYNRLYWVSPNGSFEYYDKRHLFQMSDEPNVMTSGNRRVIVAYKGIKVLLQICYDLRFPIWSKNIYDKKTNEYEYDIILYVANWPKARKLAYMTLLKARAIESQAFVVWVNRVGQDNNDNTYSGDSQVIDPFGNIISQVVSQKEEIINAEIDIEVLQKFRKKFRVGLDWDRFIV